MKSKNDFFQLIRPMIFSALSGILHLLIFVVYLVRFYNHIHTGYRYGESFDLSDLPPLILMLSFAALSLVMTICAFVFIICIRYQRISQTFVMATGIGFGFIMAYVFLLNMNRIWSCHNCTLWTVPGLILLLTQIVFFFMQNETNFESTKK